MTHSKWGPGINPLRAGAWIGAASFAAAACASVPARPDVEAALAEAEAAVAVARAEGGLWLGTEAALERARELAGASAPGAAYAAARGVAADARLAAAQARLERARYTHARLAAAGIADEELDGLWTLIGERRDVEAEALARRLLERHDR